MSRRANRNIAMLIRMHQNRAKYDWNGAIQWKPVGSRKWYVMHMGAIRPEGMKDLFINTYLPSIEDERAVVKILGWWDRNAKQMVVSEIVGIYQS